VHRTRTLWEQRWSREASNLKSATRANVFYANSRVHVSPGSYGITRWRRRRRRRDPSVIDPSHGACGKREAHDGNKPWLLHGRIPFAAKLERDDNGIPWPIDKNSKRSTRFERPRTICPVGRCGGDRELARCRTRRVATRQRPGHSALSKVWTWHKNWHRNWHRTARKQWFFVGIRGTQIPLSH
jgi:hypothetical protein